MRPQLFLARAMTAASALLAVSAFSTSAWCGEEATITATTTTEAEGYGYKFKDDLVTGGGLDASGPRLHVVKHSCRNLLIRPRTAFISELLRSVENL